MKIPPLAAFLFANSGLRPSGNAGVPLSIDPSNLNSLSRHVETSLFMSDPVTRALDDLGDQIDRNQEENMRILQEMSATFKKLEKADLSKLFGGRMRVANGTYEPDVKRLFTNMERNIITEGNKLIGYGGHAKRYAGLVPTNPTSSATDPFNGELTVQSDQQKRFSSIEYNILTESNQMVKGSSKGNVRKTTELVGPNPKDTAAYRKTLKNQSGRGPTGGMDLDGAPSFNPFQK